MILWWFFKKARFSKKTKIISTSILGLFIVVGGLYLMGKPAQHNPEQENSVPSVTISISPSEDQTVTNAPIIPTQPQAITPPPTVSYDSNGFPDDAKQVTVADIAKTPSKYADGVTNIVFTCKILSFARNDQGDAAGANCVDQNDYSSIVQIDTGNFDISKINADDTVTIYGFLTGVGQGKNSFGGEVTEALISGLYINDETTGYNNAK
jgi:hypothetical protein